MNNPANWTAILSHFDYERALSGYIATYPHHLQDGLQPHLSQKVRERVFGDRRRSDVLLEDRDGAPVVVECKQYGPSVADIQQLRHYMAALENETGRAAKGILVHGGSRVLHRDVRAEAARSPAVDIIAHRLRVDFDQSA
jgi:RecB family endonuclease NucS